MSAQFGNKKVLVGFKTEFWPKSLKMDGMADFGGIWPEKNVPKFTTMHITYKLGQTRTCPFNMLLVLQWLKLFIYKIVCGELRSWDIDLQRYEPLFWPFSAIFSEIVLRPTTIYDFPRIYWLLALKWHTCQHIWLRIEQVRTKTSWHVIFIFC